MKYRPSRELLAESLAAQVEITTWEELVKYTPYPRSDKQKYQKGDRVRVCRVGHPMWEGNQIYDMAPQKVGQLATVMGSYYDQFGGSDDRPSYTLKFDNGGESSWYDEYQMEPENTTEPCTERVQSAKNSNMYNEIGKLLQDIDSELLWGQTKRK